jgi:hypothetical protein
MQIVLAMTKIVCGLISAVMSFLFICGVTILGTVEWDSPGHVGGWSPVIVRALATFAMVFCSAFTFRSGVLDLRDSFSKSPAIAAR